MIYLNKVLLKHIFVAGLYNFLFQLTFLKMVLIVNFRIFTYLYVKHYCFCYYCCCCYLLFLITVVVIVVVVMMMVLMAAAAVVVCSVSVITSLWSEFLGL